MAISFSELEGADLIIDCVYEGGNSNNASAEPLNRLLPKAGLAGGIRKINREDGSRKCAYGILFSNMVELEWPDYFDIETGILRYYGDNREPGNISDKKGNKFLEEVFELSNMHETLEDMPPFLVFMKTGHNRDRKFLGLAVPGNPNIPPDKDLIAFWRTMNGVRFQNYEAYFTILDTGTTPITRQWLDSLVYDHENNLQYAPEVWKKYVRDGREGIIPLKSPKIPNIPSKIDQLSCDEEGRRCLQIIREHYEQNPQDFEACATEIVKKMDNNFIDFKLTRPWRDGGRDALGKYQISTGRNINNPLPIECALEAKCFSENTSVGVRHMSRLISRIKHREFGVLVTTSYVDSQAYKEVVDDGHPILIVTACDIAGILRSNSITTENINQWLDDIDQGNTRLP